MPLRKRLLPLLLAGALSGLPVVTACGSNTDIERGQTNCDDEGLDATNPQDAGCEETGSNIND